MKKSKNMSKFTAIVLLITMLTLIAIAGTYAKYTSEFTGTGSASTASWNITLSPKEGSGIKVADKTITIEIGDKIFPGSNGTIGTLTVNNGSDTVNAEIEEVEISNIKIDNTELSGPLSKNLTITTTDVSSPITINHGSSSDITFNYNWKWSGEDDETEFAGKKITFDVRVVVDQKQEV